MLRFTEKDGVIYFHKASFWLEVFLFLISDSFFDVGQNIKVTDFENGLFLENVFFEL